MSRVITFSRVFPSYHPKAGQTTYFVEKVWESIGMPSFESGKPWGEGWHNTPLTDEYLRYIRGCDEIDDKPKHHTIRAGHRFKVGDWFSPRVWSGVPYNSKQITFAPDIQVKKEWRFVMQEDGCIFINDKLYAYPNSDFAIEPLATNDGLTGVDLMNWFNEPFSGQIICWNENIEY